MDRTRLNVLGPTSSDQILHPNIIIMKRYCFNNIARIRSIYTISAVMIKEI